MTMQAGTNPIVPLSTDLQITSPTPGQNLIATTGSLIAAPNANVTVAIQKTGNGDGFYAKIFDSNVSPSDRDAFFTSNQPPAGAVRLDHINGNIYSKLVPVDEPTIEPQRNNRVVVVAAYNGNNLLSKAAVAFRLIPRAFQVKVNAQCCIWLTFASEGTKVAEFHENVPANSPVSLAVPENANNFSLEQNFGTGINTVWHHDYPGGSQSDADGHSPVMISCERPDIYLNITPSGVAKVLEPTENTVPKKIAINKLIAVWNYGPATNTPIIEIGKGPYTTFPTNPRPKRLHLAFHDGKRWANNDGEITIDVHWS